MRIRLVFLLQLVPLLAQVPSTDAGESSIDCNQLHRAFQEQVERYWRVYEGQAPGDHLAEGRKLDALRAQLRECEAKPYAASADDKKDDSVTLSEPPKSDEAERARNREWAIAEMSFFICHNLEVRARMKREIDTEVKYARQGGGVIDMVKIHENQDGMRLGDETNAEWKKYLQQLRAKPLPCDKRLTKRAGSDLWLPAMSEEQLYVTPDDAPWLFEQQ